MSSIVVSLLTAELLWTPPRRSHAAFGSCLDLWWSDGIKLRDSDSPQLRFDEFRLIIWEWLTVCKTNKRIKERNDVPGYMSNSLSLLPHLFPNPFLIIIIFLKGLIFFNHVCLLRHLGVTLKPYSNYSFWEFRYIVPTVQCETVSYGHTFLQASPCLPLLAPNHVFF